MATKPIVIKFGGEIVEDITDLLNLLTSVKSLFNQGEKIILVHGGGPLATKISNSMNIQTIKVGGRRVTDRATLEVMKMTLPGIINSNILAEMKNISLPGVTVSGISIIQCHKRLPKVVSGSEGKLVDFGFVGDVDGADTALLTTLLINNYIPVVTPLCSDENGVQLNINADTIAVEIAKSSNAQKLILITKIGGVFQDINDPNSKISIMNMGEAKNHIASKTISGGMIPKIEEGFKLLENQLDSFHIVGVEKKDTLEKEIKNPGSEGTVIKK